MDLKIPLAWTAAGATVVAVVAAAAVLLANGGSARVGAASDTVRDVFARGVAPVQAVLESPVRWTGDAIQYARDYLFAVSENRRLKQELRDLEGWRDTAIALRNVNDRYEALLKLSTEPAIPMVTGRSVLDARGPFSNARLLDVGAEQSIKVGDPVMSERGVVGRIVGVTQGASRVLLLTDVESRAPVLVDRSNARAILTGDGGAYPRLEYVRGHEAMREGDVILTSGDGGVFPRGLPVGVAARDIHGAWRARLYADRTPIDFVRVLLFQDFSRTVNTASLASAPMPVLTAAEQADRVSVLQAAVAPPAGPAKPPSTAAAASAPSSVERTRAEPGSGAGTLSPSPAGAKPAKRKKLARPGMETPAPSRAPSAGPTPEPLPQ